MEDRVNNTDFTARVKQSFLDNGHFSKGKKKGGKEVLGAHLLGTHSCDAQGGWSWVRPGWSWVCPWMLSPQEWSRVGTVLSLARRHLPVGWFLSIQL